MSWHDRDLDADVCDACGGDGTHGRGCPRDAWEMSEMEEHYRIEEMHLGAALPDEAEMTTQPTEGR